MTITVCFLTVLADILACWFLGNSDVVISWYSRYMYNDIFTTVELVTTLIGHKKVWLC